MISPRPDEDKPSSNICDETHGESLSPGPRPNQKIFVKRDPAAPEEERAGAETEAERDVDSNDSNAEESDADARLNSQSEGEQSGGDGESEASEDDGRMRFKTGNPILLRLEALGLSARRIQKEEKKYYKTYKDIPVTVDAQKAERRAVDAINMRVKQLVGQEFGVLKEFYLHCQLNQYRITSANKYALEMVLKDGFTRSVITEAVIAGRLDYKDTGCGVMLKISRKLEHDANSKTPDSEIRTVARYLRM